MFKKIVVLTFCLIGSYLAANDTQSSEKLPQVDRYQMQVVMNKNGYTVIYLLDKEKEIIWYRSNKNGQWFHLPLPRDETILLSDQNLE